MNLKLLSVLTALCLLVGCAHSVRDDSPASDLDALVSSVSRDLQRRMLPNGKEYCGELARTEDAQDECIGDLEDGFFQSNRDKDRAANTLRNGVERIKLSRAPCKLFDFACRKRQKELNREQAPNR